MKKVAKTKILGAIAAMALFVPGMALAALNPVLDGTDMFKVANLDNSADWGKTAQADPGETLTFLVHVHNNVVDTTAKNVRVQVALPANEVTSYTSRATISADNAGTKADTVSFSLSQSAKLVYVPGSTRLYNHNNQLEQVLPDGITTGGVIVAEELNGCWQYEKWVMFKAKVVKTEKPTPTPTPKPTPTTPVSLPTSGPAEAAAGIFATMGIGGAGYLYRRSRGNLDKAFKKVK